MGTDRAKPTCAETGLTIPECSCRSCLESMLLAFQPALLAEEIKIARLNAHRSDESGPAESREAA